MCVFHKKSRRPAYFRIAGDLPTSRLLNEVKACAGTSHGSFKYRFRMCHNNARESVLVSKWSLQFQIVSNTAKIFFFLCSFKYRQMHHLLSSLLSKFSLQFQIVSNSVRIHALSCSWLVSNSVSMFHYTVIRADPLPHGPQHKILEPPLRPVYYTYIVRYKYILYILRIFVSYNYFLQNLTYLY